MLFRRKKSVPLEETVLKKEYDTISQQLHEVQHTLAALNEAHDDIVAFTVDLLAFVESFPISTRVRGGAALRDQRNVLRKRAYALELTPKEEHTHED